MIRTLWVAAVGTFLTFTLASWVLLLSVIRHPSTGDQCHRAGRFWARSILAASGVRVRLEGIDRIDWSRPGILVANHQSWYDVFALQALLPARTCFVAKEELARIPIFGPAWRACGHISGNRSDRSQAVRSLDEAGDRIVSEGLTVIIFPEGTRSPDGHLQPFRKGAFVLAIQTGVPVIPVGISGSRAILPKGTLRTRSGEIRIRVGDPIDVEEMTTADRDRLLVECRRAVEELMNELNHDLEGSRG